MRIRRGFLNWGIFLVCLGAVPLSVQLGALDRGVAADLLRLWPLILVGIGLGLLLRFTSFEAIGGLVVAGTFGLLFGVLLAGGFPSSVATCGSGAASGPEVNREGMIGSTEATVGFEFTCADVEIGRASGDRWHVQAITGEENPRVTASDGSLSLRSSDGAAFLFAGGGRETWHVSLPAQPALVVSATLNASSGAIALGNGPIDSLSATFNASDIRLDLSGPPDDDSPTLSATLNASSVTLALPDADLDASMTLNASSLTLCVPPEVGLSIEYQDTLSSHNFGAAGLSGSNRNWQTPSYSGAASQASLELSANVSSIILDRSGGCPQ
jgi:hypothetical protein